MVNPSNAPLERPNGYRATRLVTPGGCAASERKRACGAATESATENRPPVSKGLCGRPEVIPRARLFRSSAFGKGEKVG